MSTEHSDTFIKSLVVGIRPSTKGLISFLLDPPKGSLSENKKKISEWILSLKNNDLEILELIIYEAISAGIFSTLTIIDGERATFFGPDAEFELSVILNNRKYPLSQSDYLHHAFADESKLPEDRI